MLLKVEGPKLQKLFWALLIWKTGRAKTYFYYSLSQNLGGGQAPPAHSKTTPLSTLYDITFYKKFSRLKYFILALHGIMHRNLFYVNALEHNPENSRASAVNWITQWLDFSKHKDFEIYLYPKIRKFCLILKKVLLRTWLTKCYIWFYI